MDDRARALDSAARLRKAAWNAVCIRMIGRLTGALDRASSLSDANSWFIGHPSSSALKGIDSKERANIDPAIVELERIEYDSNLYDLLPYVIDHHGPGSRSSVMRDPETLTARRNKREQGSYYTPADVAEYIVRELVSSIEQPSTRARYLDPACGTGVFLRAIINVVRQRERVVSIYEFAKESLFGIDINALAVDGAAFVLLADALIIDRNKSGLTAFEMWTSLRRNLVVADATRVSVTAAASNERSQEEFSFGKVDNRCDKSPTVSAVADGTHLLESIHPALAGGADIVLGNPPYSRACPSAFRHAKSLRYASTSTLTAGQVIYLYPLFVELMWRLARPGASAAGLVLPLSVACQSRAQIRDCRRAMSKSGGTWKLAFFDREPHALFGEDVKTRNAIVLRRESSRDPARGHRARIYTGPLRKWTSRNRAGLFNAIRFVSLGYADILSGVPKLASRTAADAYQRLMQLRGSFGASWNGADSCLPKTAMQPQSGHCVFVASTAYNFINVFLAHSSVPDSDDEWSQNKLHRLAFETEGDALCALAVLSSRLTYWLWHAEEDGFHVTRDFLSNLPFNFNALGSVRTRLMSVGNAMWHGLQSHQVVSRNAGRRTLAYRPFALDDIRDGADALVIEATGLPSQFGTELREFVRSMTIVDESDDRRRKAYSALATQRKS